MSTWKALKSAKSFQAFICVRSRRLPASTLNTSGSDFCGVGVVSYNKCAVFVVKLLIYTCDESLFWLCARCDNLKCPI